MHFIDGIKIFRLLFQRRCVESHYLVLGSRLGCDRQGISWHLISAIMLNIALRSFESLLIEAVLLLSMQVLSHHIVLLLIIETFDVT